MTQPSRPVEFVISTAVGGGSDIYARAMQAIIEEQKLSPQPVQPTNKEGGSGAVAFTYVFEKKGDMHYIMITLNSFFTTIITQKLPYKAVDFTPIANLALDPFFLWVNEDSPWKTAGDFIAAANSGAIWHDGFKTMAGENQGDPNGWPQLVTGDETKNENAQIDAIQKMMFAEGPGSGEAHGHYENMMNPKFHRIGVGLVRATGGKLYLTNDFSD